MTDKPASFHSPLRKAVIHVAHELKHATVSREDMANELLGALPDDPAPDLYAALELIAERCEEMSADLQDGFNANETLDTVIETAKRARQALAKARGD